MSTKGHFPNLQSPFIPFYAFFSPLPVLFFHLLPKHMPQLQCSLCLLCWRPRWTGHLMCWSNSSIWEPAAPTFSDIRANGTAWSLPSGSPPPPKLPAIKSTIYGAPHLCLALSEAFMMHQGTNRQGLEESDSRPKAYVWSIQICEAGAAIVEHANSTIHYRAGTGVP